MASLSRRTFLRGCGVALALPMLDSMTPTFAGGRTTPRRMVAVCTSLGMHAPLLFPERSGRDYSLTPYLRLLEGFRNDLTVFSGLSHPGVDGAHTAENCFLTAAPHPNRPTFQNAISLDQFAAERLRAQTRFRTLSLSTGNNSLSWTRNGVRIPADERPSVVFARLFLDGTPEQVRGQVRRLREGQSIMDTVRGDARRLEAELSQGDRARLDEYFSSVRELEQRLVSGEEWANRPRPRVTAAPPRDILDRADTIGRVRLMYDLIHLAVQTDSTRLITLFINGNGLVPPIAGVSDNWHNLSHHGRDPEKIAQLRIIEAEHLVALRGLLTKLKDTREQGETLLDRTMVLFGSNLGNASSHDTRNLPILLAGGGFRHGAHLAFDGVNNAPLCNVYVSMLQRLGVEAGSFASSTGTIRGLELR